MSSELLPLAIVATGTIAGAAIDLRTGRVPNALTMSLAAAGVVLAAAGLGRVGVPAALAGCVVGVALMLPGHLFGATGGGDVKLLAAAGTLLAPAATVWAFLFTLMAGGVLAIVIAGYRTGTWFPFDRSFDRHFAYAPAIAAGVLIAGAWR